MVASAAEALTRLREGNLRYAEGRPTSPHVQTRAQRLDAMGGQSPFAVVLACADSRVPPELVFDQGFGELFVVRTVGQAVTPVVTGSVEFAVDVLDARLVVVMGHSGCGAVEAALAHLERPWESLSPGLRAVVECVRPGLDALRLEEGLEGGRLLAAAVRANVRTGLDRLRAASPALRRRQDEGRLRMVGAQYSIESGRVTFLDGDGTSPGP